MPQFAVLAFKFGKSVSFTARSPHHLRYLRLPQVICFVLFLNQNFDEIGEGQFGVCCSKKLEAIATSMPHADRRKLAISECSDLSTHTVIKEDDTERGKGRRSNSKLSSASSIAFTRTSASNILSTNSVLMCGPNGNLIALCSIRHVHIFHHHVHSSFSCSYSLP